jgi:periplasmic protein TonB
MFEQLVESKNNIGENKREAGFLITTLFMVVSLFLVTLTYSLFAKDLGMSDEGLELSTLVAPVIEDNKPPPPEPPQPEEQPAASTQSNVIIRREAFESIEQARKPPANTSGERDVQSWVKGAKLGAINTNPSSQLSLPSRNNNEIGEGISRNNSTPEEDGEPPKPLPKPSPKPPVETKIHKDVSGGVVNGKATNLVKPQYSAAAKAIKAGGTVNVQVTIDEKGNVISASAVSGHQLLRPAAEAAARASKFTPTYLTGQAVKVTGVIVYNFAIQ